jgi:hypothetical protein
MRHYENLKLKKQYTWSRVSKNTLEVSMLNRNNLQLKVLSTTRCVADTVGIYELLSSFTNAHLISRRNCSRSYQSKC